MLKKKLKKIVGLKIFATTVYTQYNVYNQYNEGGKGLGKGVAKRHRKVLRDLFFKGFLFSNERMIRACGQKNARACRMVINALQS